MIQANEGKSFGEIVLAGLIGSPARLEAYELSSSMFEQGNPRHAFEAITREWENHKPERIDPELMAAGNGLGDYLSGLMAWEPFNEANFREYYRRFREEQIKPRLVREIERQAKITADFDLEAIRPFISELERLSDASGPQLAERSSGAIKVRAIPWLFPGVLPTHMATALTGDAGNGKTLVAVDMAARISSGRAFPVYDKEGLPACGHVIYVTSEGVPEMILVPRLMAAGANLDKVTIIEGVYLRKDEFSMFDITAHLPKLERRAKDFPDLKLMVFDPIASFLPERINPNQANSVRQAMDKISDLAYNLGVASLIVMHFAKASAGVRAIHRTAGSGQFEAAMKMSWSVIRRDGDPRNTRLLVPQKSNITGGHKSLSFQIHQDEFPSPDNPAETITTAKIQYGDLIDEDPETLICPPIETDNHVARAVDFLNRKLREGPTQYAMRLIDEAEEAGIPKWALYKAKDKLGVQHDKEGHFQGKTFWFIPKKTA